MNLPDRHSPVWDVLLGVALATVALVDYATLGDAAREGPHWANVVVLLVFGALAGLRRRVPAVACFGFPAVIVLMSLALTPAPELTAIFFGLLVFPYTAGAHLRGATSAAVPVLLLGAIVVANLAGDQTASGDWIFPPAIVIAAWLAGRNVVHRALLAAELHEAGLQAEEARLAETRRAVADERRRIAREMHDVVAHSISVMVVQAGGARRILERDPERAAQAAELVERTGRETLAEMRRLLGVMRDPETPAERQSAPTLADLEGLVAPGRLTVRGTPRPVPAGFALGTYRIVQDLLAGAPDTPVVLTWTEPALELDVERPFPAGLASVRERVSLYHGTLDTDGVSHVHVRLPLHDPDPTAPVAAQGTA